MRVSVIVPVYNAERWLEACLDSVLAQTFTDFELLLVNDGSTDGSGDICRRYASLDGRIRFFDTPNRGVSAARNLALDNARGERIVFVDSDDTVDADHLERLVAADTGERGIVFCNLREERPCRIKTYHLCDARVEGDHEACKSVMAGLLRVRCFGWTWNKMFSRSLVESLSLRFDEAVSYAEDEIFTIRYCAGVDSIAVCPHPTYNYRLVSTSLLHRGVATEVLIPVRKTIVSLYESLGLGGECVYLSCRIFYSRLRYELRRAVKLGDKAAADMLAGEIADVLRHLQSCRRPTYMRQFYDWKIFVTGGIAGMFGRGGWMKFAIGRLHL